VTLVAAEGQQGERTGSTIAVATLRRIATVDERYQSYNVEMAEVIGGNFWKPYAQGHATAEPAPAPAEQPSSATAAQQVGQDPLMFQKHSPIDLSNARLRKLAAALGPAYMRTSGTWANTVYLHDADTPPPFKPPQGFEGVLTMSTWKGVVDFTHAVNARLVSSFTVSQGVRDSSGKWTPDQARRFVAATTSAGGDIAAAEFFNEPDMPTYGGAPEGYTAGDYARDFALFRRFATADWS
jgi:heparanase